MEDSRVEGVSIKLVAQGASNRRHDTFLVRATLFIYLAHIIVKHNFFFGSRLLTSFFLGVVVSLRVCGPVNGAA